MLGYLVILDSRSTKLEHDEPNDLTPSSYFQVELTKLFAIHTRSKGYSKFYHLTAILAI